MQIKFPAVTVCNQNRVDCQKLEEVKTICEMLEEYNNMVNNDGNNTTDQEDQNNMMINVTNVHENIEMFASRFNVSANVNNSKLCNGAFVNSSNLTNSSNFENSSFTDEHSSKNSSEACNSFYTDGYNGTFSLNDTQPVKNESQISTQNERELRRKELFKKLKEHGILDMKKTSPEYTICQKMSVSRRKTIVQYLFDEGKCGKVCRKGNPNFLSNQSEYFEKINSFDNSSSICLHQKQRFFLNLIIDITFRAQMLLLT